MAIVRSTTTTVINGLTFADRAVKVTRPRHSGCSFVCTPGLLACRFMDSSVAMRIKQQGFRRTPLANMQLRGHCSVSLFRTQRLAFHCSGDESRVQVHELNLKYGDIVVLLGGQDLQRDWVSVQRTLSRVMHADLEYIAEEMLIELGARSRNQGESNSICVMATVSEQPSGLVPEPPLSMEWP
ncbi:hypothetical protein ERJ75_001366400 [Trypanosoma vivax]|uniref:PPM-type phosphatase domain-containing protein n=1 Tax=Trypanosoma vivax (strain Y486) TaxID=1055687 RepID=G0UCJ7_TRYVY|nr:hypothetical protein TRVL_03886 [Trypanosoma vivax]KAH8608170.1 hypothetical protein ERJ75_001366400 [Trypanosoma vivax]CCC53557.1 conserved hypothetical protein [Trypanosoma vivax Y486]